jgi:hypothetical protein
VLPQDLIDRSNFVPLLISIKQLDSLSVDGDLARSENLTRLPCALSFTIIRLGLSAFDLTVATLFWSADLAADLTAVSLISSPKLATEELPSSDPAAVGLLLCSADLVAINLFCSVDLAALFFICSPDDLASLDLMFSVALAVPVVGLLCSASLRVFGLICSTGLVDVPVPVHRYLFCPADWSLSSHDLALCFIEVVDFTGTENLDGLGESVCLASFLIFTSFFLA